MTTRPLTTGDVIRARMPGSHQAYTSTVLAVDADRGVCLRRHIDPDHRDPRWVALADLVVVEHVRHEDPPPPRPSDPVRAEGYLRRFVTPHWTETQEDP